PINSKTSSSISVPAIPLISYSLKIPGFIVTTGQASILVLGLSNKLERKNTVLRQLLKYRLDFNFTPFILSPHDFPIIHRI
ncbi:MAG: hypothetical protein WBA70_00585, partial [Thermodesulfobacteriota bacterium]